MKDNYRVQQVRDFIDESAWCGLSFTALRPDASLRHYYRVHGGTRPALVMELPLEHGSDMLERYLALTPVFQQRGIRVPEVYVADLAQNMLMIEDFGSAALSQTLTSPALLSQGLNAALEVLIRLHESPVVNATELPCESDDLAAMQARLKLMLDWYFPFKGWEPSSEARAHFKHAWAEVLAPLLAMPSYLQHRDYHVDNLMLLPSATGTTGRLQCGVIDFQDASLGSALFDCVSLLEDARIEIPVDLRERLLRRYLSTLSSAEQSQSLYNYPIAACLRHARVMAVFCRLAHDGKPAYMRHLPRVERYFFEHLATADSLQPLRDWFLTFEPEHGLRV